MSTQSIIKCIGCVFVALCLISHGDTVSDRGQPRLVLSQAPYEGSSYQLPIPGYQDVWHGGEIIDPVRFYHGAVGMVKDLNSLLDIDVPADDVARLITETMVYESECGKKVVQYYDKVPYKRGKGGLGIFQIHATTHKDLYLHYFVYGGDTRNIMRSWMESFYNPDYDAVWNLMHNVDYGFAVAVVYYYRMTNFFNNLSVSTLPKRASVYKIYYNTSLGSATESGFIEKTNMYCGDIPEEM